MLGVVNATPLLPFYFSEMTGMSSDVMSMSTFGRITDPIKKMDELLGYFYASDFSQSNEFAGKIQSLPHIIKESGKDYLNVPQLVETAVRNLFRGYFDEVDVKAKISNIDHEKINYRIEISIDVIQDGKPYSGTRISEVENSVFLSYPNNYQS